MTEPDDDFEELRALKAELAARHRRLLRLLVAIGVALLVAAAVVYALLDLERRPGFLIVPVGLASFGVAVLARSAYSAFSDVDTKAREDELVGVADLPPEPHEEERA